MWLDCKYAKTPHQCQQVHTVTTDDSVAPCNHHPQLVGATRHLSYKRATPCCSSRHAVHIPSVRPSGASPVESSGLFVPSVLLQARMRGLPSTAMRLYCRTSNASNRSFSSCSLPVVCSSRLLLSCSRQHMRATWPCSKGHHHASAYLILTCNRQPLGPIAFEELAHILLHSFVDGVGKGRIDRL